ncbi:hypothetical protein SAMN05421753_1126 [Planctomicrobium piriforme]|uniref:Uncharacterized protein n=2 Tax=Planctomicrobium piriforme TaxID=1576369 RepID=A0A1I3KPS1_9PLAN|nr:hypothetical protein SAMN05421753_1126 [Planctomicrobium piriforme]
MLLLAATLPFSWGTEEQSPYEQALSEDSSWVARGQSPETDAATAQYASATSQQYMGGAQTFSTAYTAPIIPVQNYSASPYMNPGAPGYPMQTQDPFAAGAVGPYASPAPGGIYTRGINGPQPVRFGWSNRYDVSFIPGQNAQTPATGNFEVFGVDIEKIHTKPIWGNWTWAMGPQFSYRSWQGPGDGITPTTDLPGSVYRLGLDMVLRTPTVNGWTMELGFDPSIASDFRSSLNRDAVLLDAHAVAFWQINPKWTIAAGVLYWDRVDNILLPYAGVIWTPNDIWELRLIFPKPRISAFLGTPMGVPTWLYVGAEYHVEAYQVKPKLFAEDTRVQLADWRVTGGLKFETGWLTSFIEGGYVFDRQVDYKSIGSDFDVDNGFIGRIGFRY